jgi:hypothetical protein
MEGSSKVQYLVYLIKEMKLSPYSTRHLLSFDIKAAVAFVFLDARFDCVIVRPHGTGRLPLCGFFTKFDI